MVVGRVGSVPPPDSPTRRAAAPFEHALADADFRARVRRGYAGEHDLLDALWWLSHPDDPGASGAPPPGSLLSVARRTLYAPGHVAGGAERYAAAVERERRDRDSLLAAVAAAGRPARTTSEPSVPIGPSAAIPSPDVASEGAGRLRSWVEGTLVVSLAVMALLGWSRGTGGTAPVGRDGVVVEVNGATGDALAVFEAGDVHSDVRFHRLAVVEGTAVVARRTKGLVCLEVRAGGATSAACHPIAAFRSRGLELPFPTGSEVVDNVRWAPDGRLTLSTIR